MMVSIVMTTYNGVRYIGEQIDSILNQTHKDFELIICDDCSTDSTWKILREYANKDERVRIFRNEKNLGYLKNYEKVLPLAKGDYIAMADQDDVWTPDHVAYLFKNIEGAAMSCANAGMIDADGRSLGRTCDQTYLMSARPKDDLSLLSSIICYSGGFQGASTLFRRKLLNAILPFPKGIAFHDMWISMVACMYGGINYSNHIISGYRIHGDNLSGNHDSKPSKLRGLVRIAILGPRKDRKAYVEGLFERFDSNPPKHIWCGDEQSVRLYDDSLIQNALITIKKSTESVGLSRILYNTYLAMFRPRLFFDVSTSMRDSTTKKILL